MAWLRKNELSEHQLNSYKEFLTLKPKKSVKQGPEPKPLILYQESDTHFGIPREYYFEHRWKPSDTVEYAITHGNMDEFNHSLQFSPNEKLLDYQQVACDYVLNYLKQGRLGASLKAAPGFGKCLTANMWFTDQSTGKRIRIADAVGTTPMVVSLRDNSYINTKASEIWSSGKKKCMKLTTDSGRWMEGSLDHPVLTHRGYIALSEIKPDDFIAVSRKIPEATNPYKITDEEVLCIGALLADGNLTTRVARYNKRDRAVVDKFIEATNSIPGFTGIGQNYFDRGCYYISILGIMDWAKRYNLCHLSKEKRIPDVLFGLNNQQLSILLRWIYTDGNVYLSKTSNNQRIELALASEGLIDDVQYLLLRFGILARKMFSPKKIKGMDEEGKEYKAWKLQISDKHQLIEFFNKIGLIPGKEDACRIATDRAMACNGNTNWDIVPISTQEFKEIQAQDTTGVWKPKYSSGNRVKVPNIGGYCGRNRFIELCRNSNYQGIYRKYADMDVLWDKVNSVAEIGEQDVYDLTVPDTQNVVIQGITVHNTVSFCYMASELKVPAVIVVHKNFLLRQWRERIAQFLPNAKIGIVQGKTIDFRGKDIVIAMAQTLVKENKIPKDFYSWCGLLGVDEQHHYGSKGWSAIARNFPCRYRIGLSGTPFRADLCEDAVFYHIGPIVYSSKVVKLPFQVKRVYTDFEFTGIPDKKLKKMRKDQLLDLMIVDTRRNNIILNQVARAANAKRRIIILSDRRNHLIWMQNRFSSFYEEMFPGEIVPESSLFIGQMKEEEQDEALTKQVLFATYHIAREALDVAALDTLVLATPTGELAQAAGRIRRDCYGKKPPIIVDIRDDATDWGLYLARDREFFYKKEKANPPSLTKKQ